MDIHLASVGFLLGLLACMSIILIVSFRDGKRKVVFGFLSRYTMPVFLMHTIFAASLRIALVKMGIGSAVAHIALGIGISFAGPIFAAKIMGRFDWMDFLLYPGKYIKITLADKE